MDQLIIFLTIFSGVSFVGYGISCLFSAHMRAEFERFGLARYRILAGTLECMAGGAQLVASFIPLLGAVAAGGLTLLMGLGVVTRLRVGDALGVTVPAIAYLLLNGFLFAVWFIK